MELYEPSIPLRHRGLRKTNNIAPFLIVIIDGCITYPSPINQSINQSIPRYYIPIKSILGDNKPSGIRLPVYLHYIALH